MNSLFLLLQKKFVLYIIVSALSLPAILPLFNKGFFPTQDIVYITRLEQMHNSLIEGQLPVRWVSGIRYGEPLFNFYAPLPYYLGALFKIIGLSYIDTAKLLIIISFLLMAAGMFSLGDQLFGRLGGVLAAMLYTYAPYHAVDIYVRGALSESWALVFFPLIFLYLYRLAEKKRTKHNWILFILSTTGLLLTHNVMSMIFLPFVLLWTVFLWFKVQRDLNFLARSFSAVLFAFGLSAFFLVPAILEKKFIQTDYLTVNYFDFRAHFVAVKQWLSPYWGYGASVWGLEDELSFQIGAIHIILGLISLAYVFLINRLKELKFLALVILLMLFGTLIMQHNRSTFVWLKIPILQFIQFPWRFLGVSIFFISLLSGLSACMIAYSYNYWIKKYQNRPQILRMHSFLTIFIILMIILLNFNYFKPNFHTLQSTDRDYLYVNLLDQNRNLPKDYLPADVKVLANEKKNEPFTQDGAIKTLNYQTWSSKAELQVEVERESEINIPIYNFPGWTVKSNGAIIPLLPPDEEGFIKFKLPAGSYKMDIIFQDTLVRFLSNIISLCSFLILLVIVFFSKYFKIIVAKFF